MSHEIETWRILTEIESGRSKSQRSMAREAGIALGLTNLLVRRMIRQGWVRLIRVPPNRVSYLITPTGIREKTKLWRAYLTRNASFYGETRDRVRECFAALSAICDRDPECQRRIVFFGARDIAEIGYVCLRDSDFRLIAVIDEHRAHFFDVPVCALASLDGLLLDGRRFDYIVITDVAEAERPDDSGRRLQERGVPASRIFCL